MEPLRNDIDDMIVREKMQTALEYQTEAWADGVADGIEPEIIADAAIALAMRETIRIHGEDGAEAMLASACLQASSPHSAIFSEPVEAPHYDRPDTARQLLSRQTFSSSGHSDADRRPRNHISCRSSPSTFAVETPSR